MQTKNYEKSRLLPVLAEQAGPVNCWKNKRERGYPKAANILITGALDLGAGCARDAAYLNKTFADLKDILQCSDLTIGQLSDASDSRLSPGAKLDGITEALKKSGFDFMTTAALQHYGHANTAQLMCEKLETAGIACTGAGENGHCALVDVHDIQLGILQYAESGKTFWNRPLKKQSTVYTPEGAEADIARLRAAGAQFILCFVSWQAEGSRRAAIAAELAELGVQYIIGHDAGGVQAFDCLRRTSGGGVPAAYSLGSLLTEHPSGGKGTVILDLRINRDKYGNLSVEDHYLPCMVWGGKQERILPITNKRWSDAALRAELARCETAISHKMAHYVQRATRFDIPAAVLQKDVSVPAFELPEESEMVQRISQSIKFTETYRDMYGDYVLKTRPNGTGVRLVMNAIRKYKHVDVVNKDDYIDLIKDVLYTKFVLGFRIYEYFCYDFEHKSIPERLEYVSEWLSGKFYRRVNTSREDFAMFRDKYSAAIKYQNYFKREFVMVNGEQDREAFLAFAGRHERFIMKPNADYGGTGVRIIDRKDYSSEEALAEDVMRSAPILCEELIVQAESIKRMHPNSVNTVRAFTVMSKSGVPQVKLAYLRTGRGGSVVDNISSGGFFSVIDTDTGKIVTDGYDWEGNPFVVHPDSKIVVKGYQIERWDELMAMLHELALMTPKTRVIGWDCALSEDRGWQIVEGNTQGVFAFMQIAAKRGMRKEIETLFEI